MRATWYVLEDGTAVDPNECAPGDDGVLTHKDGAKVKMRSFDCPMSTGVEIADDPPSGVEGNVPSEAAAEPSTATSSPPTVPPPAVDEQMTPDPAPKTARKPGYKTRKAS